MKIVTTSVNFVKLFNEKSKRLTILWQDTAAGSIETITVFATDSSYKNGKEIPDADVSIINVNADKNVGFQYEFPIPFNAQGELQPYDFYFEIICSMQDKSEVIYDTHSFYKPDGNPGSEGDGAGPKKP